uniref:DUF4220 domain-containing protein n=1 Tax=Oryza brachyantha TaxID=4533 RepID=J3N924_ORYBR
MILIELSSLFSVAAMLVLVVGGSYRRVRVITWVAYAACIPMVSYTLGLMQSYHCKNNLFSVWAISLVLFLGSSNSLSAFSHKDNDEYVTVYLQLLIQALFLGSIVGDAFMASDFGWPIYGMLVVAMVNSSTRLMSLRLASRGCMLSDSTKWVADYMSYEHELSAPGDRDPVTMRGYRYIVDGEPRKVKNKPRAKAPEYLLRYDDDRLAKLVTVDKVWGCRGSLLLGGDGGRLKDLCLSMALSKMLNRRFVGLELAESDLQKTHDFLFHGRLHGGDDDDDDSRCERAFRVIEEELAFVHDFFYTKYAIHRLARHDILLSFLMIPFCINLACIMFHHFLTPNDALNIGILIDDDHRRNYDALLTFVIAVGIALVEFFQVFFYLASGWCKLALVSRYVARESWNSRRWVGELIGRITRLSSFRCWERRLGQYTLLMDFDYRPMNPMSKRGRRRGNPVEISMDAKRALVETLKRSNGVLTNGVTSLRANGVELELSWSCTTLPTTMHTILAWHVATTICEAQDSGDRRRGGRRRRSGLSEQEQDIDRLASLACSLSKYMAYLVAFAPDLLPDHGSVSGSLVDAMVAEAGELLKGERKTKKKLRARCSKLMEMVAEAEDDDHRLIVTGARLGSRLMVKIREAELRWKVVSDFWTEMLLHVAPSDDARAHLETLPRGGELITHLWALLTHGGILDRVTGPTHLNV